MSTGRRKISKEIYDRAKNGVIAEEDMIKVFDSRELCGYGIYSTQCYKDGDEYYVRFRIGDSCD